jgi:hypothetical protein
MDTPAQHRVWVNPEVARYYPGSAPRCATVLEPFDTERLIVYQPPKKTVKKRIPARAPVPPRRFLIVVVGKNDFSSAWAKSMM